ncbi:MAG: DUF2911 domain-containing protein [Ignavibacteriae bacterium]|nr:DUF2911 domain-containing protein [Ignavibacteriota bacterium]
MINQYLNRLFLFLCCCTVFVQAQQPLLSPRDSVSLSINGKWLSIDYGRPSRRDRPIMGSLVPYNRVWRTGANEATTFVTTGDIRIGDAEIPRGTYTLYTFPSMTQWKLIINKQTGQWGTTYNPDLDFARIDLKMRRLRKAIDTLTITLGRTNGRSGILTIEWEYTSLSAPFEFLQDAFIASPRDTTELVIDGKRIVIDYGRPSRRGRTIMGAVVPFGEVWRTGANEATTFSTEADLVIEGVEIPRGSYTLYTLPSQNIWKLILNKQTGQWGTEYDRAQDQARINMKKQSLKNIVERFTITLEKSRADAGVLKLIWEKTQLSVRVSLKKNAH